MVLEEPIAHHHKGNLNLFLTRVRGSRSLYFTKIHSRTTTSTKINRKVITQTAKSSLEYNIAYLHLMIFCRTCIPILYFPLWSTIIKSRHWISNQLTHRITSNFRWSLDRVGNLTCKTRSIAKGIKMFKFLIRSLTVNPLTMALRLATIPSLQTS